MAEQESVTVETVTPKSTQAEARGHAFVIDKPESLGGHDRGPMASEYFLAALASCHITTAHKIAEKRRAPLRAVRIEARQWLEDGFLKRIHLAIFVAGDVTPEERETLFRLTERSCTISRATSVPIERSFHPWPPPASMARPAPRA